MRSILARSPHESSSAAAAASFSFSRRHSYWLIQKLGGDDQEQPEDDEEILCFDRRDGPSSIVRSRMEKQREFSLSFSRFRSAVFGRRSEPGLGRQVMGTLFGRRGGRMHFAVQGGPGARPALLVELGASTAALVREMESGMVRIALECERLPTTQRQLTEEPRWRAYCNGKKCGEAVRRECGREEWRVLGAVERVTMGAGVLPAADGEVMYMRARFERVVVSKDYEAYFVINPDNHRGPELTVYLLRNLINTNKIA